jgi:hypothetical protein
MGRSNFVGLLTCVTLVSLILLGLLTDHYTGGFEVTSSDATDATNATTAGSSGDAWQESVRSKSPKMFRAAARWAIAMPVGVVAGMMWARPDLRSNRGRDQDGQDVQGFVAVPGRLVALSLALVVFFGNPDSPDLGLGIVPLLLLLSGCNELVTDVWRLYRQDNGQVAVNNVPTRPPKQRARWQHAVATVLLAAVSAVAALARVGAIPDEKGAGQPDFAPRSEYVAFGACCVEIALQLWLWFRTRTCGAPSHGSFAVKFVAAVITLLSLAFAAGAALSQSPYRSYTAVFAGALAVHATMLSVVVIPETKLLPPEEEGAEQEEGTDVLRLDVKSSSTSNLDPDTFSLPLGDDEGIGSGLRDPFSSSSSEEE